METVTSVEDASQLPADTGGATSEPDPARPETSDVGVDGVETDATVTEPPGVAESFVSLFSAIGRALSVLSRPRVAGVLIGGLGVLIIFLLGYIYVFTPVSAARSQ